MAAGRHVLVKRRHGVGQFAEQVGVDRRAGWRACRSRRARRRRCERRGRRRSVGRPASGGWPAAVWDTAPSADSSCHLAQPLAAGVGVDGRVAHEIEQIGLAGPFAAAGLAAGVALDDLPLCVVVGAAGGERLQLEILQGGDRRHLRRRPARASQLCSLAAATWNAGVAGICTSALPIQPSVKSRPDCRLPDVHRAEVRFVRVRIADALHDRTAQWSSSSSARPASDGCRPTCR